MALAAKKTAASYNVKCLLRLQRSEVFSLLFWPVLDLIGEMRLVRTRRLEGYAHFLPSDSTTELATRASSDVLRRRAGEGARLGVPRQAMRGDEDPWTRRSSSFGPRRANGRSRCCVEVSLEMI